MSEKSKTTRTVTCDRCGKQWELEEYPNGLWSIINRIRFALWLKIGLGTGRYEWNGKEYDLCPECNWELRKWLKGYDNENMSSTYKLVQIANDMKRSDEEKVIDIFTELGCELVDVTDNAEGMYLKQTLNRFKNKVKKENE